MPQSKKLTALDLKIPNRSELSKENQALFNYLDKVLGFMPNVLVAYSQNEAQLGPFSSLYTAVMTGESGLSELEREMIGVAVSSSNHCFYCLTAHGATIRQYSEDPILGEKFVMNYRTADLSKRHKAMIDFAIKITESSYRIEEVDRQLVRDAGFSDRDIWDIANVAALFNMTNRVASATDLQPNEEYHYMFRKSK